MFSPLFYPHIGGVEKHVMRLSEELIRKGNEVTIITRKYTQKLKDIETHNQIKIYRVDSKRGVYWLPILKYNHLIKNSDIIHLHDYSTFIYWYFPFRIIYPFKKVYITFHGYEGIIPIPKTILFMRKLSESLTLGNICIGDFIPRWYNTKTDVISYGGVDEPIKSEIKCDQKGSAVFVGRLEKDTGILKYIDAIKILKKKYNVDIEVNICGDGTLKNHIEKDVKENKLNVNLCGFVENPNDYLIKSNIAFVSGYLSILEAMINKKLVFSIYENELKKDYLCLMPNANNTINIASSSQNLAEQILYYHKNPEKAEAKINNAYHFAKNQTWESVSNSYIELWGNKK
jgi:glycosyltransferase involved in cell wall biosynthesis